MELWINFIETNLGDGIGCWGFDQAQILECCRNLNGDAAFQEFLRQLPMEQRPRQFRTIGSQPGDTHADVYKISEPTPPPGELMQKLKKSPPPLVPAPRPVPLPTTRRERITGKKPMPTNVNPVLPIAILETPDDTA